MTTLAALMAALVAELADGEVPDPLRQPLTLASIWSDLARLAGEDVPAEVAAILDGPAIARVPVAQGGRWLPREAVGR